MFTTLRNAWKIADLRKKILFTLFVLVIFRLGCNIPVPFVTPGALAGWIGESGNMLGYMDMLTGGSLSKATLFALSVTPYINASIIVQLLTVAIPALERMSKEGEEGHRKLNRITRWMGCVIALGLAVGYYFLLKHNGALTVFEDTFSNVFAAVIVVCAFTAGSMLIMWLGEQIDSKGIGNGVSLLIFAGIVSRMSSIVSTIGRYLGFAKEGQSKYYILLPVLLLLTLAIVVFIVILQAAERRIPVQYAKRVVGRKMYGGQSTHIPIKVNMSGVMPIIFASSIISIPATIGSFFPNLYNAVDHPIMAPILGAFKYNGWAYAVLYTLLILAFNYFYVAVQYNPQEIANNLQQNNGMVPGYRPGKPTSDFITKVLGKITFVGALFLAVVAVSPIIIGNVSGVNLALGGTSLLIVVGVALDTVRSLEGQMIMRHHKGFLE